MNRGQEYKKYAQTRFLRACEQSRTFAEARRKADNLNERRVYNWFEREPGFHRQAQMALRGYFKTPGLPPVGVFRKRYLGLQTYPHQQEWLDAIEANNATIILVARHHSKTTVLEDMCIYRIAKDRNVRIAFISKSHDVAKQRLHRVQRLLSDSMWYRRAGLRNLIEEFGPFKPGAEQSLPWSKDRFYVSGVDSGDRDPTFSALGVGNQIYGAHFDLIILDDVADFKNQSFPGERAKMLEWILQEATTSLTHDGKIVVIATRVHEEDIYSQFLSELPEFAHYKKIVHPAILDEDKQKVLWPEFWPYDKLVELRSRLTPRVWSMVYQQEAIGAGNAVFSMQSVENSKDDSYSIGHHAEGLIMVMGVDPAFTGTCAIVVLGLDRNSGLRWIIDAPAEQNLRTMDNYKDFMVATAARYKVKEARVEKNAMQGGMNRDSDLIARLARIGCRITEEFTAKYNKYDHEQGVLSVASAFDAGLYRMPWTPMSQPVMRPLADELMSWRPQIKRQKQDRVMAMWLAELSARRHEKTQEVRIANTAPQWLLERRGKKEEPPDWIQRRLAGVG